MFYKWSEVNWEICYMLCDLYVTNKNKTPNSIKEEHADMQIIYINNIFYLLHKQAKPTNQEVALNNAAAAVTSDGQGSVSYWDKVKEAAKENWPDVLSELMFITRFVIIIYKVLCNYCIFLIYHQNQIQMLTSMYRLF